MTSLYHPANVVLFTLAKPGDGEVLAGSGPGA